MMKTKLFLFALLLMGVSVMAQQKLVVYQDCSLNGQTIAYSNAPAGVEMVDLGLSVKWANMNVGATSPEEYGLYFAWGETQGYTSNTSDGRSFDWASYKYCNGSSRSMTKYCTDSGYGTVDNKTTLEPADDAAHVNWGGNWRMPTHEEQEELINNCSITWTTDYNGTGVAGRIFTSNINENSVFFPAAGYREGTGLSYAGSNGYYWPSSLRAETSDNAWKIYLYSGGVGTNSYYYRSYGLTVRAVAP